ncbi:MAG: helix-turn-helix domain-containing protein [Clostridia bacterium]|nr:helix-turn-helix domain-containing protein [Clostridia bacterium]
MENYYIVKKVLHYCNVQPLSCRHIPPKPIPYYDLTFVLEGSLTYIVDGTKYILNKNDGIFIKPGMIRERLKDDKQAWWVSFNFESIEGFDLSLPVYHPDSFSSDMKKLIQIFPYRHIPPDNFSKQKAANLLNFILFDLLEKFSCLSQNSYINEIIRIVDEGLTKKLTLQGISAELNLSKEYTSYIFRKETGKTLTNYINEQKMIAAKEFVTNSGMPLAEISKSLGFDNYNYFSRLFKKHFALTPIDMRKKV